MEPSAQGEKVQQANPYLNARHNRDRLGIPFWSGYIWAQALIVSGGISLANLQHIAQRVFRNVNAGRLAAGYAPAMGMLIDLHEEHPGFHEWANAVSGSAVENLLACMVRAGAWDDPRWLEEYLARVQVGCEAAV